MYTNAAAARGYTDYTGCRGWLQGLQGCTKEARRKKHEVRRKKHALPKPIPQVLNCSSTPTQLTASASNADGHYLTNISLSP